MPCSTAVSFAWRTTLKAAFKRERCDACISMAEREQTRYTASRLRLSESDAMLASAWPSVSSLEAQLQGCGLTNG